MNLEPIKLKDDTTLVSATARSQEILTVDEDWWGHLWVATGYGSSFAVVNARGFEVAYEALLDALPPIAEADIHEAYGFYGDNAAEEYAEALREARQGTGDWPELGEGYAYQPNATGTGIVEVDGLYLEPLTRRELEAWDIHLQIRHVDAED